MEGAVGNWFSLRGINIFGVLFNRLDRHLFQGSRDGQRATSRQIPFEHVTSLARALNVEGESDIFRLS